MGGEISVITSQLVIKVEPFPFHLNLVRDARNGCFRDPWLQIDSHLSLSVSPASVTISAVLRNCSQRHNSRAGP